MDDFDGASGDRDNCRWKGIFRDIGKMFVEGKTKEQVMTESTPPGNRGSTSEENRLHSSGFDLRDEMKDMPMMG